MSMMPNANIAIKVEKAREREIARNREVKLSDTTFADPPTFSYTSSYTDPLPGKDPDKPQGKPSQEQELRHRMGTYNHKLLAQASFRKEALLSELVTVLNARKNVVYDQWYRHSKLGNEKTRGQLDAARQEMFESEWHFFNNFLTDVQQFLEEKLVKTINDSRLKD